MEVNLSERFPSLSPFAVRAQRAKEVFLLIERINRYDKRNKADSQGSKKKRIRRKAGDDWF